PEPASSGTALIVRLTCGASPVKRLPREAPSTARRPGPSAGRGSISRAAPVALSPLDIAGVLGVRARHHVVAVLLVPAEAEDVVVAAVQDAAHARAGLRAPVAVPLGERVAALDEPTSERGHVAVADRAPHRVEAQPVDLQ